MTSKTASSVGETAKQAVRFLRQFHGDVHALVRSLDATFGEAKWDAAMGAKISGDLSNALNAEKWVLNTVTRIYVPRGQAASARHILAVSIEFAPEAMSEAVLLCVMAQFPVRVDPRRDVWDPWSSSDAVIAFLATNPGSQELSRGLLDRGFMPGASIARGFVVPLCSLSSAEVLHDKVVTPALALMPAAGEVA